MNIAIGASPLCFAPGGTERVAANLAHALLNRGHNIHIFAFDYGRPPVFALDGRINLHLTPHDLQSNKELAKVRRILTDNNVDVFLSLQSEWTHMLWALSCLGSGIPFICSERSDPRFSEKVTWNKPGRQAVLASADAIHELLATHIETVPEIHRHKIKVIPNAAPKTDVRANPAKADGRGVILFLARFIPGKRADLLIRAFARLTNDFPGWRLRLAGYGQEESALRKLVRQNNLADRTDFVLHPQDWQEECKDAQIYCLPTKVEGFPNSALEAMACGLPLVGIADCPAMAGIVENGVNGFLAAEATPEALATCLAKLMESPQLRGRIGQNCLEQCATIYESKNIWDQWEAFLEEIAARKGRTIMDGFREEPFASRATLAAAARREYLYRDFGDPMPWSWPWWRQRSANFVKNSLAESKSRISAWFGQGGNIANSLMEAAKVARTNSWTMLPYYFRQIEKTRRAAPGRSLRRTELLGDFVDRTIGIANKKMLCAGCGDKRELEHFRSLGAHVTGIDLHGAPGIQAMSIEKMDFADNSFDLAYACHSFEHCADQRKAASELMRVVRPGGHVAIEVPVNVSPGKVDLHSCHDPEQLVKIFSQFSGVVVSATFCSRNDPGNGAGEDICRMIYQKS